MEFGNQYIKTFNQNSEYSAFEKTHDFVRPNVSYCISENEVHYSPVVSCNVGDYLYSDYTVSATLDTSKTAIGVCVIPTNTLPDGRARFISLKAMNCDTPDTGSATLSTIKWGYCSFGQSGPSGYDNPELKNYNKVVTVVDGSSTLGVYDNGYLMGSDGTYERTPHCPSPFSNFAAYSDTTATKYNALSDFDGYGNTQKILTVCDSYGTSWRTDSTISNSSGKSNYPAAQCCWRYSTSGTSQGQWYLPSMGELGFLYEIKSAISDKIVAAGGPALTTSSTYFWSSTEYSNGYARYLTSNGIVFTNTKDHGNYVFAFLAF